MPSEYAIIFISAILELLVLVFVAYEVVIGEIRHYRAAGAATTNPASGNANVLSKGRISMRLGLFIVLISGAIWVVIYQASTTMHDSSVVIPPPSGSLSNKYTWEPLTTDDVVALRIVLRSIPKPENNFRIICIDPECRSLALGFISVFNDAEWAPYLDSKSNFSEPTGLVLYVKDINNHTLADSIEKATKGRFKLTIRPTDDPRFESLFVGLKP